jgi:hypothetical protein
MARILSQGCLPHVELDAVTRDILIWSVEVDAETMRSFRSGTSPGVVIASTYDGEGRPIGSRGILDAALPEQETHLSQSQRKPDPPWRDQ